MGFGHRVFLVDEQDVLRRVPSAKLERMYNGQESLPEFAGQRVRCADVMVELENRVLTGWYREWYYLLPFDSTGKVDRDESMRGAVLAMEANPLFLGPSGDDAERSNVVSARGRFAKVQLAHQFRWEPGHRLRQQILDLALGRKRLH